jgi:hypothetical protein
MDNDEEQLALPLDDTEDNRLYVENLTAGADSTLCGALGKYERVFIIGIAKNATGFDYMASDSDCFFWAAVLQKAQEFIMRRMF